MLRSMPIRRFKRGFKLGLIKLLVGNKAAGAHLSYVGRGASADLCRRIVDIGHTDILVVTDKALKELGLAERALAPLADAGVKLHWYAGVDPDPTFAHVMEGAEVLRSAGCTAIVAVGGGSSMDAAKIIACTRTSDESPDKWVGLNKVPDDVLPIYAIPTTSGTGSEATMGAVIKDPEEQLKHIIVGEGLLPQAVALDPDLLLGLPAPVTAATGIDALTHGIEAYICIWTAAREKRTGVLLFRGCFAGSSGRYSIPKIWRHVRAWRWRLTTRVSRLTKWVSATFMRLRTSWVPVTAFPMAKPMRSRYRMCSKPASPRLRPRWPNSLS